MSIRVTKKDLLAAIVKSGGNVSTVAKRLGVSRTTVYNAIERHPEAKEVIDNERENLKDFAENKLIEQIGAGNMTAIIFYLKTQARDRGYVERREVDAQVEITKMYDKWSPDDWDE